MRATQRVVERWNRTAAAQRFVLSETWSLVGGSEMVHPGFGQRQDLTGTSCGECRQQDAGVLAIQNSNSVPRSGRRFGGDSVRFSVPCNFLRISNFTESRLWYSVYKTPGRFRVTWNLRVLFPHFCSIGSDFISLRSDLISLRSDQPSQQIASIQLKTRKIKQVHNARVPVEASSTLAYVLLCEIRYSTV